MVIITVIFIVAKYLGIAWDAWNRLIFIRFH